MLFNGLDIYMGWVWWTRLEVQLYYIFMIKNDQLKLLESNLLRIVEICADKFVNQLL